MDDRPTREPAAKEKDREDLTAWQRGLSAVDDGALPSIAHWGPVEDWSGLAAQSNPGASLAPENPSAAGWHSEER